MGKPPARIALAYVFISRHFSVFNSEQISWADERIKDILRVRPLALGDYLARRRWPWRN